MDIANIPIGAVFVATLSTFVVGGLWYGPLFGEQWINTTGLSEEDLKQSDNIKIFGLAFIFELIMAFNLAIFLQGAPDSIGSVSAINGAIFGFLVGFGWVFFALAVNCLFEKKSWKYILINGGYWTISFTTMGLILGAWQ